MGQSDFIILAVSLLGLAFIGYFLFSLTKPKGGGHGLHHDDDDGDQHRPRGNLRRRRVGGENNNEDDEDEDDNNEPHGQEGGEPDFTGMTKKEIAKIEKRRAKAQQREAMEADREERKEKEEARMEELREREQEKEEEFLLKEADRLRELAVEEQQRLEKYNHWKDPFPDHLLTFPTATATASSASSIGGKGDKTPTGVTVVHDEFIAYLKETKTISLDKLGVRFDLPIFNCIEILKHLVKKGDIFGVFVDDGEQFMCVNESVADRVASFASQQGSVLMTDISKLSSDAML